MPVAPFDNTCASRWTQTHPQLPKALRSRLIRDPENEVTNVSQVFPLWKLRSKPSRGAGHTACDLGHI